MDPLPPHLQALVDMETGRRNGTRVVFATFLSDDHSWREIHSLKFVNPLEGRNVPSLVFRFFELLGGPREPDRSLLFGTGFVVSVTYVRSVRPVSTRA